MTKGKGQKAKGKSAERAFAGHLSFWLLTFAFSFALCPLPFALLSAQVRDAAAPTVIVGTGAIAGVVQTDEAVPRPLRKVLITLVSGNLQAPQTTVTDEAGRFAFMALPAGSYSLQAVRPGYVSAFYGGKRPGKGPGVPVAVADGQRVSGLAIKMLRGAVVTGIVRSDGGQPNVNANVQVLPVSVVNGQRRVATGVEDLPGLLGTTTDDRGRYRAFGLPPGEYIVQVPSRTMLINGNSSLARLVTAEEVRWAMQSAPSSVPGQAPPPLPDPPQAGQTVDYAPVFHPGTTSLAEAATIHLSAGEERDGVDVSMRLVPTAKVTGTVLDPSGRPSAGAQVALRLVEGDVSDMLSLVLGMGGTRTGPDGTFTLPGVRPGRYTLTARASDRPAAPVPAGAGGGGLGGSPMPPGLMGLFGGSGNQNLWASQDLPIDGRDVTDLQLTLRAGMTISGRLVFEATTTAAPDVTRARIMMTTAPSGGSMMDMAASVISSMTAATIGADGRFEITGVTPNGYRLNVLVPGMRINPNARGTGWMLKAVMLDGKDIADQALMVKPNENVTDVVVTLTDKPTELSGTVLDAAGKPVPGFPIVVFSTDRASWTVGSRRVRQVRPSNDGKFYAAGLPAGSYYVCAVTDLDQNQLYDPSFLESLAPSAFTITLADGEQKTQNLKLAGGG